jgi:hypothetical protein
MSFIFSEYTTSQRKQYINSKQVYEHYIKKKNEYFMNFNLSMYWRKSAGKAYLTKKHSSSNRVTSLGVKSEETIKIYDDFVQHKKILKEEISALEVKLDKARKLNKIEFLTRTPSALVEIYQKINELKLDDKMILIGTNALYAYESHCALFVEDEQLATEDIDLLAKENKELSVIFREVLPKGKLSSFIKLIDKSFEQDKNIPYRFRNKKGVLLEVISPTNSKKIIKPNSFMDILDLEMQGMQWLENSRIFKSMVVGEDGKMAILSTIHPLEYAVYKHWLSLQLDRNIHKKNRDIEQSKLVSKLIGEYMVNIEIEDELKNMKHFNKRVIDRYIKEIYSDFNNL